MTDKKLYALIRKAIRNDKEALVELCKIKARDILYLCRLNTRTQQDADDAAQEVFLQVQKSITQLRKPESFNAWLSRLITYTCNSLWRKNMKHENYVPIEDASDQLFSEVIDFLPQQCLEDKAMREQVVEAVKALPDAYRQCVLLHYFQQLSYKEIADILDITQDKVGNNLRMARKHIKVEIDDFYHNNDQKLSSTAPMVALGSALPTIFSESAKDIVSAQSIAACLKAGGIYSTAVTGAVTGAGGSGVLLQSIVFVAAVSIGVGAAAYTVKQMVIPLPTASSSVSCEGFGTPQNQTAFMPDVEKDDEEEPVPATNHVLAGRVFFNNASNDNSLIKEGLSGVVVELVNADSGVVEAATYTQDGVEGGAFCFKDFEKGAYRVRVVLPTGLRPTGETDYASAATATNERSVWLKQEGASVFDFTQDTQSVIDSLLLAVQYEASIKGRVSIKTSESGWEASLPSVTVSLLNPQGVLLATAEMDASGWYYFADPPINQSGYYSLSFSVANVSGLQIPGDTMNVFLCPGQNVLVPAFELLDVSPPQIDLVLTGGECECGHLNPTGVSVAIFDATTVIFEWNIFSSAGEKIARGSDTAGLSAKIASLAQGEYLLAVVVQDAAGNRTQQEREVSISGR